ncbi:MAG: permease [Holophaga sp.]|jgi:uncharacterized membrane protein
MHLPGNEQDLIIVLDAGQPDKTWTPASSNMHNTCMSSNPYTRERGNMTQDNFVVAVYPSHETAECAIKELQHSGFEIKKLSIIGQDIHTDEHVIGYYNLDERMKAWGKRGAFWGGLWGLLFGSAFFMVPGLGPLLVAGPLVSWIVGALEGAVAVGGLSIVGAALYNLGIPKDSILRYEKELKTGKYVLIVHGAMFETTLAKEILNRTEPQTLDHHEQAASELRTCAKP